MGANVADNGKDTSGTDRQRPRSKRTSSVALLQSRYLGKSDLTDRTSFGRASVRSNRADPSELGTSRGPSPRHCGGSLPKPVPGFQNSEVPHLCAMFWQRSPAGTARLPDRDAPRKRRAAITEFRRPGTGSASGVHFLEEPGTGQAPVTSDRLRRHLQDLRGLLDAQPSKETELYDPPLPGVHPG
jgi:hypothetical protein